MKPLIVGMLAHVDAGKTTLTEAMLYTAGKLKSLGRVDHGSAFLDFDVQELTRGITIFSKEAICTWKECELTLLDTPGHVDFSAEMERTLQVLDVAVLVISGVDGVQAHTETIWRLLKHYHVPVFIFVNKQDIAHASEAELMAELQRHLDEHCVSFMDQREMLEEQIALCSDALLEEYLEHQTISKTALQTAISKRVVIPCYFGSALKLTGIETFLDGLDAYTIEKSYPDTFGAVVYKISHDDLGNRLTHLKLTGGTLHAKEVIQEREKVDQIRRYHGASFRMVPEISAGHVCAIKGFEHIQAGEVLGVQKQSLSPVLSSSMQYRMVLPEGMDAYALLKQLRGLMAEDPSLHITYDQRLKELHVQVRGEVQIEVLQRLIQDRYDITVSFDEGRVSYRETIMNTVEGVGHYEPLRHYAEVHLLLEPLPRNQGLVYASGCSSEDLEPSLQRAILSYLQNEEQLGVLTGSMITDMKITVLSGKVHEKHTSGGDFREATRRALRQGLKLAQSQLLEPCDKFRIELPNNTISRCLFDLDQMGASYDPPSERQGFAIITGTAPTQSMNAYAQELRAYTKGKGKLFHSFHGFIPVKHQTRIIQELAYNSETDIEHPTGSIFCMQGAGTYVPWNEVYEHMHVPLFVAPAIQESLPVSVHRQITIDDEEVKRVTAQLHQPRKKWKKEESEQYQAQVTKPIAQPITKAKPMCLLVDGYNMIFSWNELKEVAEENMDHARTRLLTMLANYQGYKKCTIIIVYDAYKTDAMKEAIQKDHHVYIVYTKKCQTADSYIEKATHCLAENYHVIVATSDAQEQNIILGQGATRMSSNELYQELKQVHQAHKTTQLHQPVFRHMPLEELRQWNEQEETQKKSS